MIGRSARRSLIAMADAVRMAIDPAAPEESGAAGQVLIAYATTHGSTREVAQAIGDVLHGRGLDADVRAAGDVSDLAGYDAVVLGGALYTGRWHRDARRFLSRNRAILAELPVAVFAMGPQDLAAESIAGSRAQLDRALKQARWLTPVAVAIFGGVVDPAKLRFPFNRMPACDARDWDAIGAWADAVGDRLVLARLGANERGFTAS
jgi:menaquinone-dependent protoporphyrinogen oxidase